MRSWLPVAALAFSLCACDRWPGKAPASAVVAPPKPLLIAPEDVFTLRAGPVSAGPLVTGSIAPERRADLRAEVSAMVLAVLKENGDPVVRGEVLVRLDDTAIRDSLVSAQAAERVASQALEQAQRQLQRLQTLRLQGMASVQQLEDAEIRRNSTQGEMAAAQARVVQARQQQERTVARAPFDGIVSERRVSAGDSAQLGKELLKVIDPRSLRFEGLVASDAINAVQAGQAVSFKVHGHESAEFEGRVRRLNPMANPTTRQTEVLIDFVQAPKGPARMAGLYAEGRIAAATSQALLLPATALVREGDQVFAWRLGPDTLSKVSLSLGERDPRRGDYVVRSGLADGDVLLRYPGSSLKDGHRVDRSALASPAPGNPASGAR